MLGWSKLVDRRIVARDLARAARWWLVPSRRRRQDRRLSRATSLHDYLTISPELGGMQIEDEIAAFFELTRHSEPRWICEIGTARGGTTFLFTRAFSARANIIGIDLYVQNRILVRHFRKRGQRIHFIDGDSHAEQTIRKVEQILRGEKLDILFIDGDHTYDGVARDFMEYRRFVREGGIIAFHDIQPDGTDQGLVTGAWVGGVPQFWNKVKSQYPARELIGSPTQYGFGIGLITYSSDVQLPDLTANSARS
jgi:predicted O-methyltransferase YrrM